MSNIKKSNNLPAEPGQFMSAHTPEKLMMGIMKRSIRTETAALKAEAPSLADIKKQYGIEKAIAFVMLQIDDLANFMNNDKRQMNQSQQRQTAMLILENFFWLNTADIALVFNKIKGGHYEKSYGPINGQYIMQVFRQYQQARSQALAELQRKERQEQLRREMENIEPHPERARAILNKLTKKFKND